MQGPIVLSYVQRIFLGGAKHFLEWVSPPCAPPSYGPARNPQLRPIGRYDWCVFAKVNVVRATQTKICLLRIAQ